MALRDVEVVDDEATAGPQWSVPMDPDGRPIPQSSAILHPDYIEWAVDGGTMVHGYVTIRWWRDNLVLLRASAACSPSDSGVVRCTRGRYASFGVQETGWPAACIVSLIERAYWPNWQGSVRAIHPGLLPASAW